MISLKEINNFEIIIVGAGISGITLAERFANVLGKKVLLIDRRKHIGGNCFDFKNKDGILVPKYGPHFFHTNNNKVWGYVNKFSPWIKFEHRVLSSVGKKLLPIPVNIDTVNQVFKLKIQTKEEMELFLNKKTKKLKKIKNSEEVALSRVGSELYELLFKEYTKKHWGLWPKELSYKILERIPVRTSFDDRYFTDKYQSMPKLGYTKFLKNMLKNKNIKVLLDTDWKDIRELVKKSQIVFFTGSVDQFFNYDLGQRLEYRSLRFTYKTLNKEWHQSRVQINYPSMNIPYTRIVEPKHATLQKSPKTTIIYEYPTNDGEPCYPLLNKKNINLYKKYKNKAVKLEKNNIYFIGRLGNYKYINMDQAFENALSLFDQFNKNGNN